MTTSKYTILRAGTLYGRLRKVGETIELSEREAKYPRLNGMIEMVEEPAPAPEPAPAKTPTRGEERDSATGKQSKKRPKKAATARIGK